MRLHGLGARSLFDPAAEHDACGVGFVASLHGPSRDVLEAGLSALSCLSHRGALAADAQTGDGAGVLVQVPQDFFREEWERLAVGPAPGALGVGALFLPQAPAALGAARAAVEAALRAEGLGRFVWRPVPVEPACLGIVARKNCPHIAHLLVARPDGEAEEAFERRLYRVRRRAEHAGGADAPYTVSLSSRTMVYKGLMLAPQLAAFYPDLADPRFVTAAVIYHQRYSTNTEPTWARAQPYRFLAHNGEINTLRGNVNWMRARERDLRAPFLETLGESLFPVTDPGTSDSGMLDNAAELFRLAGRDLRHVMMMLVPEAWEGVPEIAPARRDFYRYHACLMEPWDGPAAVVFGDGRIFGCLLDRNGLRPMRYTITDDGLVVAGSEVGVVGIAPGRVRRYGKLGPGEILAVDLERGEIQETDAVKDEVCGRRPYGAWLQRQLVPVAGDAPAIAGGDGTAEPVAPPLWERQLQPADVARLQVAFAYTKEERVTVIKPMVEHAKEGVGSMGDDTPHAVLSSMERPLFHYFKQRFAEVTNPPIDHLREGLVFSLRTLLGPRGNPLEEKPGHARLLELGSPVLTEGDMAAIRRWGEREPAFATVTLDAVFPRADGPDGLEPAVERLCREAAEAVAEGAGILILSDRAVDEEHVAIPALMATGAVHHHLIRRGLRMRASLVVDSAEPREIHHLATLLGYGANAVHPYLALAVISEMATEGRMRKVPDGAAAVAAYRHAAEEGLKKVMSKMGISTVESYTGAQIFEAVGVAEAVIAACFPGTVSRFGGNGFREFGALMLSWHEAAFGPEPREPALHGFYRYREGGEVHEFSPAVVDALQAAVAPGVGGEAEGGRPPAARRRLYGAFLEAVQAQGPSQIRHLLDFRPDRDPVPLEEVEPAASIVRRFSTGSISLGSLSPEAHETLAIAMNRLGARSGSGEGGEDIARFGTEKNSAIKQVASGRFGVTPAYLASAVELQIKMAQGSKPGEGGQIPGLKVTEYIARIRHTTPGVALISPPPHHDIYSIEDLAQLIYDLKQVNPEAEVSVKLVAQSGVGIIAAGVAKGHADIILISGHSGGTGSSPLNSIKNAGLPWEIGLAETQQTLVANGLRERVALRADGGFRSGRDVVVAALLGADQYSFGTAAMVAEGCIMMRVCHTDNCPVGVATQKEALRRKFTGSPQQVMDYFLLLADEVREILARLGYRSLDEVIGRADLLAQVETGNRAADRLDLSPLLAVPDRPGTPLRHRAGLRNALPPEDRLDAQLVGLAEEAIAGGEPVTLSLPIRNTDRTVGAALAFAIARRHGDAGLPPDSVCVEFQGVGGQSFGAFLPPGVSFHLVGIANDYVGKGLAGGEIVIRPDPELRGTDHVLLGNTVLYGATGGTLYAAGRAGERFAVRNSGATAVVEGVGGHGCEYMTGGTVVVLGPIGHNFAAGMTGGEAFVLDEDGLCARCVNTQLVKATPLLDHDRARLQSLVGAFAERTGSARAAGLLADWERAVERFVRLAPKDEVRQISSSDEGSN
jgi:glutamate synthase (ferredoxin)